MDKKTFGLPAALRRAQQRFAAWRGSHRPRARLAKELWDEAVALGRVHGHHRTARALGLDYNSLGRHLAAACVSADTERSPGPAFVELLQSACPECSIELESRDGDRMRILLKGVAYPAVDSLIREFRGGESCSR